jgi:cyclopropane-fatty-acyl-phospholipid synthase
VTWAAERHGVRARGITLSRNQARESRRRAEAAGLADRVTIDERHYTELPASSVDAVASIGMYEHVGRAKLPEYFAAVRRALRPGGLFLNHGITRIAVDRDAPTGGDFVLGHVFPGAELPGIAETLTAMEAAGLEVLDVHALRPHYAWTLREWARRFRARREEAARLVPERVLRTWDLYLPGCAQAFEDGLLGVYQVLATAAGSPALSAIPLMRDRLDLSREWASS